MSRLCCMSGSAPEAPRSDRADGNCSACCGSRPTRASRATASCPGPGPGRRRSPTRSSPSSSRGWSARTRWTSAAHWRRMAGLVHYLARTPSAASTSRCGTSRARPPGCPCTGCSAPAGTAIPAYFSTAHHQTPAEYAEDAVYWQEQGWRGYKLHPPRGPWLPPAHGAARRLRHRGLRGRQGRGRRRDDADARLVVVLLLHRRRCGSARRSRISATTGTRTRCPTTTSTATSASSRHLTIPLLATEITPGGLPRCRRGSPRARPTSCAATSSSRAASPG